MANVDVDSVFVHTNKCRYDYVEETGLYHYEGDTNYAGYTLEELEEKYEEHISVHMNPEF